MLVWKCCRFFEFKQKKSRSWKKDEGLCSEPNSSSQRQKPSCVSVKAPKACVCPWKEQMQSKSIRNGVFLGLWTSCVLSRLELEHSVLCNYNFINRRIVCVFVCAGWGWGWGALAPSARVSLLRTVKKDHFSARVSNVLLI